MKKALVKKSELIESMEGDVKYGAFLENEVKPEPVEYVIVIEDARKEEFIEYLKSIDYDTEFMMKDTRGEDIGAAKGIDYLLPGIETVFKSIPKRKDAFGKVMDEMFNPCRERMHLKFWDIEGKLYGTAHTDMSLINFFWKPIETIRKHKWFRKQDDYGGEGDYTKGTRVFYFEDLAGIETLEYSKDKEFLESQQKGNE